MLPRIKEVKPIPDYCLRIVFDDGRKVLYDVKEDIKHPLFEPKKDPYEELFTDTSTLASKGISGAENLTAMNLQGER